MANVPIISWSETTPAGGDNIAQGDDKIREAKKQIREIINVDHDFPSSGQAADNGQHKQVTLQEQADLGTGAVSATILGSQTIDGRGELVYTDEDDNDIQLTKAGVTYPSQSTTLADWAPIMALIYPVGSIYANASDATNPATLLGIGTWVAIEEEVIAGYKAASTFDPVGTLSVGAETVTLTGGESGTSAHNHPRTPVGEGETGASYGSGTGSGGASPSTTGTSSEAVANDAHNNIQPTYVAYLWRRTA